ncbi:DUF4326 domain-containing protein [Streptomyces rubiginosohelvolus]|uniref:DUF4326 domain-containing protein n=1 Tax=Streptomyces rubiginosohelvolus TaxID=67362 RepID=UPI003403B986
MTTPARIQRRRTKGWRKPDGAVYVGRPTLYGNPFQIAHIGKDWLVFVDTAPGVTGRVVATLATEREARQRATEEFRAMLRTPGGAEQAEFFAAKLHGRDLMCWCPLPADGEPDHCHASVLLDLANTPAPAAG